MPEFKVLVVAISEARPRLREIVEATGEHFTIVSRYDEPVAVVVSPQWFAQALGMNVSALITTLGGDPATKKITATQLPLDLEV